MEMDVLVIVKWRRGSHARAPTVSTYAVTERWINLFMKTVMMVIKGVVMAAHLLVKYNLVGNAAYFLMIDLFAPQLVAMGSTSPFSGKSAMMETLHEVMDASTVLFSRSGCVLKQWVLLLNVGLIMWNIV
jgi:hypothetical protein